MRALVRDGTDASRLEAHDVEVVRGDLLDEDAVRRAATGCERVYHLAGKVDHRRSHEAETRAVNVDGVRIALAASDPDARFVHASSISTIGPARGPDDASDESVPFPAFAERYVYHRSKRDGERLALDAAAQGRDIVVANIGFIIGPEDDERVTGWMVERYLKGVIRFVVEGGLSFFDVRDAAAGLVELEERGRAGERTILTNRAGNLPLRDFYARVGRGQRRVAEGRCWCRSESPSRSPVSRRGSRTRTRWKPSRTGGSTTRRRPSGSSASPCGRSTRRSPTPRRSSCSGCGCGAGGGGRDRHEDGIAER